MRYVGIFSLIFISILDIHLISFTLAPEPLNCAASSQEIKEEKGIGESRASALFPEARRKGGLG